MSHIERLDIIGAVFAQAGQEHAVSLYTQGRGISLMFAPVRFLWNATRGNRFTPWRSEYLKWRIETYSGKKADSLKAKDVLGFVWESRWELLDFLAWTGRLERDVRRQSRTAD